MRSETDVKSAYERKLLEMLLRHELPDDCDIKISVTPKGAPGQATFKLSGGKVDAQADLKSLNLRRIVPPHCW